MSSSKGKKLFTRTKTTKKKQDSRDDLDMDHHLYATYSRKSSAGPDYIKTSKSNSLGSVTSEPRGAPLEQEDFLSLMHDVRNFSDALGKLKEVFQPYDEGGIECDMRVSAHEKLGEVLSVLRNVVQKCPALHTTDVLTDAAILINKIKGFHYEDICNNLPDLHACIDQLALDFSISVSEYLMGDVDTYPQLGKTKSYDNLATTDSDLGCSEDFEPRENEELDAVLMRLDYGMDLALSRAKAWSKYTKEIISYVEKRASLECDFAKGLLKLATSVRQNITEDSCPLPFQSIYCSALDQDLELASTMQSTCNLVQTQDFLEPLTQQRHDHEKVRKHLKEQWTREVRKMQEAVNNLRKAQSLYVSRQQEFEKAKEIAQRAESESLAQSSGGARADRKKKYEEEAMHRAIEAETTYKGSVAEANNRQKELERTKADILGKIRDLIQQCDQTMKTATIKYFHHQQTVTAPLPVQYKTLYNSGKQYEPGWQYDEFVRRLALQAPPDNNNQDPFVFEPFTADIKSYSERKPSTQSSGSGSSDLHFSDDSPDKLRGLSPLKAWSAALGQGGASDTDSISGSSCKSAESSPTASPSQRRATRSAGSAGPDEIDKEPTYIPPGVSVSGGHHDHRFQGVPLSRAAQSHVFKKLRTPSRCRECESYVYFNGAECEKCGLTSHRRCLEGLHWECGHDSSTKSPQRRMTTFGVDLNLHVQETQTEIPILVQKCCEEIDLRGLQTKGIYRLSGVKSRVEKLCQNFETDEGNVDLSEHHPNVIANVLKLYLRQLPEPLLTYHLYPVLIALIKEEASLEGSGEIKVIQRLNSLLADLPISNFRTLALLIHHLKRVTENEESNQMSASNLGIVFGPTLLRPSDGAASLNSLMDTPHQTKIVELLITHVDYVFGPEERPPEHLVASPQVAPPPELVKPKETPVEPIQDSAPPTATETQPEPTKEAPTGVEDTVDGGTGSGESKWYITGESLLDELAREEPRFAQPSEEFLSLPGSATPGKSELPERLSKSEEVTSKTTPAPDSQVPDAAGDATAGDAHSDEASDEELPLPDDSNTSPLLALRAPVMVAGAALVASLTGMPALGPSLACPATATNQFHHDHPLSDETAPETPRSSLLSTPIAVAASSPGLRRKLLQKEVLGKSAATPQTSTTNIKKDSSAGNRQSVILSQPKIYSPPVHRRLHRISGVKPSSRTADSLDLATYRHTASPMATGAAVGTEPSSISRSVFYAPNVIQPDTVKNNGKKSSSAHTSTTSMGVTLAEHDLDQRQEFV